MITYLILHYNRPYFLDLNIQLIRKFLPKDTFIVLVDDGSLKSVVDSVKDKADLFIGGHDHTEDSCCRVLSQAMIWLKKHTLDSDYIIFSEDDFLFWPSPIVLPPEQSKGEGLLDPSVDIPLPKLVKNGDPIQSAINLLRSCKDIHIAQISRPVKGNVHYAGDAEIKGWKILDHAKMPKYYYTDWPFMMRYFEFLEIPIPRSGGIPKFEASNCRWFDTRFGKDANYAAAPERPYYFHVGYPFSLQPIDNQNDRRKKAFRDLQRAYNLKQRPEELSKGLCENYIQGILRFDLQQVEEVGLQRGILETLHSCARHRVDKHNN